MKSLEVTLIAKADGVASVSFKNCFILSGIASGSKSWRRRVALIFKNFPILPGIASGSQSWRRRVALSFKNCMPGIASGSPKADGVALV